MRTTPLLKVCVGLLLLLQVGAIRSQDQGVPQALSTAQIVERIERRNQEQLHRLKHYQAQRHYEVEYKGFSKVIVASMDVEAVYDASSGKSFQIISQSGSRLLCDKVLKQALASEKEASLDPGAASLSEANYQFHLAGQGSLEGRSVYMLDVEPLKPSKFLYRGEIWVDAENFAVVKVDAEPAKNPSFWISRTSIEYTNAETDGFWLPKQNRSETRVRIGGTAVLKIDYGTYQVTAVDW